MTAPALSRLVKVELREVWTSEAADFTPWLALPDNLTLLGETVGIDLQLEAQEKDVGPFRADILCKDTATDAWVLIENQLERTDHTHLGQLLTYAAGLKAVTIVWIAFRFTEEHRAALDWLNEITDERFNFFGLEVELWRIGDSAAAPKFNIISKPNDWTKNVARGASRVEAESVGDAGRLYLDLWAAFAAYLRENSTILKPKKPQPFGWMPLAIGRTGFALCAVGTIESNELRAELVINHPLAKAYFAQLETYKAKIEGDLHEPLIWSNRPEKLSCKIFVRRGDVNLEDQEQWAGYFVWFKAKLEAMHRVLAPIVRSLEAEEGSIESDSLAV